MGKVILMKHKHRRSHDDLRYVGRHQPGFGRFSVREWLVLVPVLIGILVFGIWVTL